MPRWTSYEPPPSSAGEPQAIRDAWDKQLQAQAQAQADAELKAALAEIEAG